MGVVHAAEHIALGEEVALKFLLPEFAKAPDIVERFLREARSQFRIKSDHVVRVLDVDTAEFGAPFLVMELLDGQSISDLLDRRRRLLPHEAAQILLQTCEALAAAHGLGIVHRDVKPQNVMVTPSASGGAHVKLLDFGIAQVRDLAEANGASRLTGTQSVIGTPSYMAPEQLRSARGADPRSDLWSVGVMAYQMLTGRLPWVAESVADLVLRQYHEPPTLASNIDPSIPPPLSHVIARCLSVDPAKRFPSAAALAEALRPFARAVTMVELKTITIPQPAIDAAFTFHHRKVYGTDGGTAFEVHEPIPRHSTPGRTEWINPASFPHDSAPHAAQSVPPARSMRAPTLVPIQVDSSSGKAPPPKRAAKFVVPVGIAVAAAALVAGVAIGSRGPASTTELTASSSTPRTPTEIRPAADAPAVPVIATPDLHGADASVAVPLPAVASPDVPASHPALVAPAETKRSVAPVPWKGRPATPPPVASTSAPPPQPPKPSIYSDKW
jgi:serine/threonine-protein kinase